MEVQYISCVVNVHVSVYVYKLSSTTAHYTRTMHVIANFYAPKEINENVNMLCQVPTIPDLVSSRTYVYPYVHIYSGRNG